MNKNNESSSSSSSSSSSLPIPNYWMLKPVGLSRGRGISMISDVGSVKYDTQTVVQQYLRNPLLIDGFKWDMRLYVLVTSFDPLEAWLYKDGFIRFSTRKFTLQETTKNDGLIHLTNSSVQKKVDPISSSSSSTSTSMNKDEYGWIKANQKGGLLYEKNRHEMGGTKRSLEWTWETLIDMGILEKDDDCCHNNNNVKYDEETGDKETIIGKQNNRVKDSRAGGKGSRRLSQQTNDKQKQKQESNTVNKTMKIKKTKNEVWNSISEVIIKSLICVDHKIPNNINAFECFGYDIILDEHLKPWLLEVNASPSMSRDNNLDYKIKNSLISDIISIVDPIPFNRNAIVEILQ
eukprot:CAMPEP_0114361274 /NCGR_PEP_ID=MMETSP0101-20121206/24590_1 /TAXON_ID=38822 ORGANISM="Pteridomonas danica, Strain PT" /NCGR_SAMPLE_ID=MMETSP0101 /ASSEMBLY_ACC=CAM_ASM_000211 /LENGTH=347 /DNA_ID=CAMNT_0001506127 /DNA_START=462 /DNA_END=1502 /DNA_ORIENTATION=+